MSRRLGISSSPRSLPAWVSIYGGVEISHTSYSVPEEARSCCPGQRGCQVAEAPKPGYWDWRSTDTGMPASLDGTTCAGLWFLGSFCNGSLWVWQTGRLPLLGQLRDMLKCRERSRKACQTVLNTHTTPQVCSMCLNRGLLVVQSGASLWWGVCTEEATSSSPARRLLVVLQASSPRSRKEAKRALGACSALCGWQT